ncbi:glycosyltransferase family 61 protein [Acidiphilium sp.]|uniref:glycosyltransferase family 61 protein n=1 Tax=Acidiphilium sp. TaxID=527 RepID=UPI003CFEA08C
MSGFAALRRAVRDPEAVDCQLRHTPDRFLDVVPHGLVAGRTVFGAGQPTIAALRDDPVHRLQHVASVLLNEAILAPDSMAVLNARQAFFEPSIANLAMWNGELSLIDGNFTTAKDGWRFADSNRNIDYSPMIALPVGGVGGNNYGHFLYDGLPAALHHRLLLGPGAVLAGRTLLPWQAEILEALDLLDGYIALEAPTRFRKLLTSTMVSFTVSYPNRFIRTVFDRLRFRFGTERTSGRRLMISRDTPDNRRIMDNRSEIEAIAADFGFELVRPATMSVAEQARLFASAVGVIGESGAGLANLGFCDPGTRVLEIQPDRFSDGWTRASCHLFGLRWQVFFATGAPAEIGTAREFQFTVDPGAFRAALATVFGPR